MAYEYIKRTYTFLPRIGARVRHTETGRVGIIQREKPAQAHYVQVMFDGDDSSLNCHPMSLEYIKAEGRADGTR